MMLRRALSMAILCATLAVSIAACGGNNAPAPTKGAEQTPGTTGGESVDAAATTIYQGNCMSCHATDLAGSGSFPSLQTVGAKLSESEISTVIHEGRNGMPSFAGRLSEDEIKTLSKWLSEKK